MAIGMTNAGSGGTKSIYIVTGPTGSTVTLTKGTTVKTAAEKNGTWRFNGLENGSWTLNASLGDQTTTKSIDIPRFGVYYDTFSYNTIPEFTYTGDYEIVDDNDNPITTSQGNWKIRFLTSGTLVFTDLRGAEVWIDAFLVGAGGGSTSHLVGGCGGGYTQTSKKIKIAINTPYEITIGAGGVGGVGGSTSAFDITAAGGKGIASPHANGLDGGSGGAGISNATDSSIGGSDGADGANSKAGSTATKGGKGQIASPGPNGETGSTREFGESDGRLYASGGSGGGLDTSGPDGGGGGYQQSGKENTGGGGGGRYTDNDPATNGGSGIVIIRNHREEAA